MILELIGVNGKHNNLGEPAGLNHFASSILDGFSRLIVHWEIHETMKEAQVVIIIQRALEKHPDVHPRMISDNGPQFVARDFKSCGSASAFQTWSSLATADF